MKKPFLRKALGLLFLIIVSGIYCAAQPPGGGPPPGMRPPGGRPPGRPGGNPEWNQNNENMSKVRQKKRVREGDTFVVVGYLRDSLSGEPLPYVNVAVLDSVDNEFVKGTATNINGRFEISGVPQGGMVLRVSAIGYGNRAIPFHVSNNTDLGVIRLMESSTALNEVTVTAERPLYAMEGEKLIYNVSEDPSIQTGTTEDALQNAPGVEVDVEGNITLRGVSSVEIWINDKPSKLTEENLKTYLQTLPANAIARIETITNPSAKYATSAEAVINIVTSAHIKSNQFVSFGINGSNQPFVSPWISYMWKKEKLSINMFASGRYSDRRNTSESWALQRIDDEEHEGEYINTWADTTSQNSSNRRYTGNMFMNVNYEIDSTSEISFDGGGFYNRGFSDMFQSKRQTEYFYPEDTTPYWMLLSDTTINNTDDQSIFGHIGADYTKKFDDKGHNLRIGLNTTLSNNANEQWYNRFYDVYTDLDEHRYLLSKSQSYGGSLDARYNRPYNEDGELSYGLRADHHQASATYTRYNDTLLQVIDTLRTYQFKDVETEMSADVNWTHRWGGFTLSTGLGLETERTDFNYYTDMPFADDSTYWHVHLRPSIHLTYRTESMHNWKLNYTMRMSAPDYSQITRFRSYGDDSYSVGNRGLKDSFTHNVEAGWQKFFERFGNIGIEAYGRWSTNEISSLRGSTSQDEYLHYYDDEGDIIERLVNYTIPYNLGTSWRYGASLNMTYRPSGFFNVRMYANVYDYGYHMEYDRVNEFGETNHITDKRDMVSWSLRVNAWAKIYNQLQLTASAFYNSPTLSLMSERKARYSLNMGVRSDFFKRKVSVFVNVQDIFNWGATKGSGSMNTNPYYLTNSTNYMINSRYISAGITFRFGKLELEQQAKEGSDEAGDTL